MSSAFWLCSLIAHGGSVRAAMAADYRRSAPPGQHARPTHMGTIARPQNVGENVLHVLRYRAQLRRLVRQIDFDPVDVAPAPTFRRVVAFDDRVMRRLEVCARVPVRRIIAAADMTAPAAEAQMHPLAADLEALFAALGARRDHLDGRQCACSRSCVLPVRQISPQANAGAQARWRPADTHISERTGGHGRTKPILLKSMNFSPRFDRMPGPR